MPGQSSSALRISPYLLVEPPLASPVVALVKRALSRLSAREASVLRLHYGLNGRSQDLAAIARVTGLSVHTVRRVRRLAFKKLRWLAADLGPGERRVAARWNLPT
jgi:DNA-directed RNA polymerase specialized sigma24 family protein